MGIVATFALLGPVTRVGVKKHVKHRDPAPELMLVIAWFGDPVVVRIRVTVTALVTTAFEGRATNISMAIS